jgi:hypothetical protein
VEGRERGPRERLGFTAHDPTQDRAEINPGEATLRAAL